MVGGFLFLWFRDRAANVAIGKLRIQFGETSEDVREIISALCKYKNVDIIAGAVCEDHVHLSVAIPPKLSVSNFMGYYRLPAELTMSQRKSAAQGFLHLRQIQRDCRIQ